MPKPKFQLTKETKVDMTAWIKEYFLKERDEDLGDLSAMLILDFFIDKLATEFYNQGVFDAHKYMAERAEDLLGLQK